MATTTTTTALKLFPELWSSGFLYETSEEEVIDRLFARPQGARKIGQQLHIPKVKRIAATGGSSYSTGLTYTANTEGEVTVDPVEYYAAVEVARSVYRRMDTSPESVYRKMLLAGCAEFRDQEAAELATGLTTNQKGGAQSSLDYGLIADAAQALVVSSKSAFKVGVTPWNLVIHPTQYKNLLSILTLIADYIRGDGEKPVQSGWVVRALNARLNESGNIYQANGITHNMGFLDDAFVAADNEEPTVLDPQPVELVVRIIAAGESGWSEQFDEYAVDVMTAA